MSREEWSVCVLAAVGVIAAGCVTRGNAEFGLPTVETRQSPVSIVTNEHGRVFVDFGKDAFGWLELVPPLDYAGGEYQLALGEARHRDNTVDTWAGGEIRSWLDETPVRLSAGSGVYRVEMTANPRNTGPGDKVPPVRLRREFGVVLPFRYVEFFKLPFEITADSIRRVMVHYPIDMRESSFGCSDGRLTEVYDFCKYSILATSFAGLYVDGDRERIPYEGDAYINQLSNYAISSDGRLARASHEYLLRHPTWPTEWKQHSIMMAWADWMWTGETTSLAKCYDVLRDEKLFLDRMRPDGLIVSFPEEVTGRSKGDIVDWPPRDRDGFVFRPVNAVINAFHYRNLNEMEQMARALGRADDAEEFAERAVKLGTAYRKVFRDPRDGLYRDGEGTDHKGFHASVVALAFGLVPEDERRSVADRLVEMGMRCSVYFAQYYLEALYAGGRADAALALMTSDSDRSWFNMMKQGSTIAMEAWNLNDKPNLDWNHAWGTSPLNIISRHVLGVTPLEPGFAKIGIAPQVAGLSCMTGVVPTVRGPVRIEIAHGILSGETPSPARIVWRGQVREVPAGRFEIGRDGGTVCCPFGRPDYKSPRPPDVDFDERGVPSDAQVLFDGTDLSAWRSLDGGKARWPVLPDGTMRVDKTGNLPDKVVASVYTRDVFTNFQLHVEFRIPIECAKETSQWRGNSGVKIFGCYEVQILDSYRRDSYANGLCGALYCNYPPAVVASKRLGEWQTYDIVFHAPVVENGKVKELAAVTVLQNGVLVQNHVHTPPYPNNSENAVRTCGDIELQSHNDDSAPISFRNIWIRRLM